MLLSVRSTVTSIGSSYDSRAVRLMFFVAVGKGEVGRFFCGGSRRGRVSRRLDSVYFSGQRSRPVWIDVISNGVLVVANETGAAFVGGVAVVVVSGVSIGAAVPVDDVEIAGTGEPAATGCKVAVVSW